MTQIAMAPGRTSLMKQAALVLGGTGVLALSAQVSVPFYPVSMTLQTLAILVIGMSLGARLGTLTVLAWYGQAMLGAPVLMNFGNAANFVGPSAGFLLGFIAMVFLSGLATDRGAKDPVRLSLVALVASAVIYLPGLAWPLFVAQAIGIDAGWAGLSLEAVLQGFALPFLLGDVVKAILAAVLVSGGLAMLRKRG